MKAQSIIKRQPSVSIVALCISLSFLSAFFLPTQNAHSAVTAYPCNGCSTAQVLATAEANCGTVGNPLSNVYVYDLTNGRLYNQSIHWTIDARGNYHGPCTSSVINDVTNNGSAISNAFVEEKTAIAENGGPVFLSHLTYQTGGFPSADTNATAFDVIEFSAIQNDISDALIDETLIAYNIDAFLTSLQNTFLSGSQVTFQVVITLVDNSQVTFQWTPGTHVATLTKAVDANNNTIPITASSVAGSYRFNNGGLGPFANFLGTKYGITIPGGVPTCTNATLACITTGDNVTTCEVVHCL